MKAPRSRVLPQQRAPDPTARPGRGAPGKNRMASTARNIPFINGHAVFEAEFVEQGEAALVDDAFTASDPRVRALTLKYETEVSSRARGAAQLAHSVSGYRAKAQRQGRGEVRDNHIIASHQHDARNVPPSPVLTRLALTPNVDPVDEDASALPPVANNTCITDERSRDWFRLPGLCRHQCVRSGPYPCTHAALSEEQRALPLEPRVHHSAKTALRQYGRLVIEAIMRNIIAAVRIERAAGNADASITIEHVNTAFDELTLA